MLVVAFLGVLIGLSVSVYIYGQKQKKTSLICPREGNCDKVVHSTHATTFGVGNEILGIVFYVILAVLWGTLALSSGVSALVYVFLVLVTLVGLLFTLYLIALQALVIRAWCMWCLGSALAVGLLTTALFGLPNDFFVFLRETKLLWVIVHNIGFVLGLGGATITDVAFFRFLRDGVISEEEKETMGLISRIIWVGLAILIVSGVFLVLPDQARLLSSPKFLLKIVVVGVIIINGILLNVVVAPRMRILTLRRIDPGARFRKLAFALGGISATSWYTAFLLGSMRSIPIALREGVVVYVGLLLAAVIGSQLYERLKTRTA